MAVPAEAAKDVDRDIASTDAEEGRTEAARSKQMANCRAQPALARLAGSRRALGKRHVSRTRRAGPNTLSARLKPLEEPGIIQRRFYERHPPRAEYRPIERDGQLRPVLRGLLEWGERRTKFAPPAN